MAHPETLVVNAWTQWGSLETVVVGRADPKSCHLPHEPACHAEINDPHLAENIPWPGGCVKHAKSIERASAQLANLCAVLEAETVRVKSQRAFDTELGYTVAKLRTEAIQSPTAEDKDGRVLQKGRIETLRPTPMDWSKPVAGPGWNSASQYCATCPRDTMITLGHTILEGTMSKRSRYFEHLACREISLGLWRKDPQRVKLWACPKPSMADSMYHQEFFQLSNEQRFEQMRQYKFCVNETEPVFDAADITRVGKDIFVQKSMTTNDSGIRWLTTHFPELRVHPMHFPYDLYPSHIDCTFVPLRPPSADGGGDGLALINAERPPLRSEAELWTRNGWKLLAAPLPAQFERPAFSQSSYWLSMNILSIEPATMVMEENEIPLYNLLRDYGFDPITVPFRHVYEFGGGIHCSTWDIKRQDACVDYFPEQEFTRQHVHSDGFSDTDVVDISSSSGGFLLNPSTDFDVGTHANILRRKACDGLEHSTRPDALRRKLSAIESSKEVAAEGVRSKDVLHNGDRPAMEDWETAYMETLVDLACAQGGDVLQVGFGSAPATSRVQTHRCVTSHTIVEPCPLRLRRLALFAGTEADAGRPAVILEEGHWVDVVERLRSKGCHYDAILYGSCPQIESEIHLHQFIFMNQAWDLLKPGGRFVYYNIASIAKLKEPFMTWGDFWTKTQVPYLTKKLCRFNEARVSYTLFKLSEARRGNSEHYVHDDVLCPVCVK